MLEYAPCLEVPTSDWPLFFCIFIFIWISYTPGVHEKKNCLSSSRSSLIIQQFSPIYLISHLYIFEQVTLCDPVTGGGEEKKPHSKTTIHGHFSHRSRWHHDTYFFRSSVKDRGKKRKWQERETRSQTEIETKWQARKAAGASVRVNNKCIY